MLIKITSYDDIDSRKLMNLYAESNIENVDYFYPNMADKTTAVGSRRRYTISSIFQCICHRNFSPSSFCKNLYNIDIAPYMYCTKIYHLASTFS